MIFGVFLDALQDGHFSDSSANLGPKRLLLGDVFRTLWGQAEPVKIVLSCWFWLGSEDWTLSQSRQFSKLFRACFSGAMWNDILHDFSDFRCPFGRSVWTTFITISTIFSERDSGCDFRAAVVLPGYFRGTCVAARRRPG